MTNPTNVTPGKVNALTRICGIKTVNKYSSNPFVKRENAPKVTRLRGRVNKVSIGLSRNDRSEKASPAWISVIIPPLIVRPAIKCAVANKEKPFIEMFRARVFMGFSDRNKYRCHVSILIQKVCL